MKNRISRAPLLLLCSFSLLPLCPAKAQGPAPGPAGPLPPEITQQQPKPAEVKPPASLLDMNLRELEGNLRKLAVIPVIDPQLPPPVPVSNNSFPYSRTLRYSAWGMDIEAREADWDLVKVAISVPWNAATDSTWPELMKALHLPADTPNPSKALRDEKATFTIPGEGRNWVAVNHYGTNIRILVGKREFYENAEALAQDTPKEPAMIQVIQSFGRRVIGQ